MKVPPLFLAWTGLLVALCVAGHAAAQVAPTASLVGTVMDSSGAVVPGATVLVKHLGTELTRRSVTGPEGSFTFTLLPVGRYQLRAEAPGFLAYEQTGITLNVDSTPSVTIVLSVGPVTEQVTVTADAAMVNTQSGTLSQVVQDRYIESLPLNGRNAATLVRMVPGTVTGVGTTTAGYANTDQTQAISVNGARGNEVNYKLDGATHMDNITNLNAIFPNPDALAEFNVQTSNFGAQFGNFSGAVVNIVTRSGTNAFHGSLFEFLRNGALNARNFIAAQSDNLKRNQFGGTLGGPVKRNRLFFFGSYQGTTMENTSFTNVAFVPSAAMRQGDFSALSRKITDPETGQAFPGNRIPADRILPIARAILEKVPLTHDPTGRLIYARPNSVRDHQMLGKLDYNLARHMMSGSVFYVRYDDPGWDSGKTLLTARIGQLQTTRIFKFQDVYTVRPNLINTFVASALLLDSSNVRTSPYYIKDFGEVKFATPDRQDAQLELGVTGYSGWGSVTNSPPGEWIRRHVEVSNTVTYLRGKHTLLFGAEASPYVTFDSTTRFQQSGNYNFSGVFTGDGMADLLLGRVNQFVQSAGKYKRTRGRQMSMFIDDKFNITGSLTLNFGLRWDPFYPYHDLLGQVSGYRPGFQSQRFPNAPVGSIFAGDPGFPQGGMHADTNNLSPRFGFAWNPRKGARPFTVRGGYGVFFVRPFPRLYNNFVENAPFSPSVNLRGVDMVDPYGSAGVDNPFPPFAPVPLDKSVKIVLPTGLDYFHENWSVGYSQAWNLTLEQQVGNDVLVRLAYVGNKGTHLQSFAERNWAIYRPGATVANTDARRPLYPNYRRMREMVNDDNSIYHSLQATVDKRFSRNFSVLAFYTFSKSIDDSSINDQFTIRNPNPYDLRFNLAISDYDVPHNFRMTGVYDLPRLNTWPSGLRHVLGGWSVTQILDWRSGTPFSLTSGRDNSFSGIGLDRADLLGNPRLDLDRPKGELISKFFDTTLVRTNAVGTFGNAPRNFLRNLRHFNFDAGVQKNFALRETWRMQLRGEFFNFFNNTRLGQPGANVSAQSTFGRITGAGAPRIIQLALKLQF